MHDNVILLSIPGLRQQDLASMPNLKRLVGNGDQTELMPSFPAMTCPVQANMTTGTPPSQHGVIANGFYWKDKQQVEMWTAWNECIGRPQIWDLLSKHDERITSAVWFPLHSKGCGATYICTPAPIHNPDGSESLWCYTKPTELYGELRDLFGHFPLQHFWGPMAGIPSSAWIADSAAYAAEKYHPNFFYIYVPQLDYAAQKHGPDSAQAMTSIAELDDVLGKLIMSVEASYSGRNLLWFVASEYTIVPVDHVAFPNRVLREAGLLEVKDEQGEQGEQLDLEASQAWALCDHQMSHVFVRDADPQVIARVAKLFRTQAGIDEVLVGDERAKYDMVHERSGDLVLVSSSNSWQAYYWWFDDAKAPSYARTVDIHRKPGYDPVELFFDPVTKSIPLDATRVKGSHGAPARKPNQRGVLLSSHPGVLPNTELADTDVAGLVLRQFGI